MKLTLTSMLVLFALMAQGQDFMDLNKKELQVDYQKRLDEIALKNKNIAELEIEKTAKIREIAALQTKIGSLSTETSGLRTKMNSLTEDNKAYIDYINKNTPLGLQNNFSKYLHPEQVSIGDFLDQFEEATRFENEIPSSENEMMDRYLTTIIYKNGISIHINEGFEQQYLTLFVPINSKEKVTSGLVRLMLGCPYDGEDEVSYTVEVEKEGVKLIWSDGCG